MAGFCRGSVVGVVAPDGEGMSVGFSRGDGLPRTPSFSDFRDDGFEFAADEDFESPGVLGIFEQNNHWVSYKINFLFSFELK